MRAACLVLALCVSYAAAAVTAPKLDGSDLTPDYTGSLNGRQYIVKQVAGQAIKFTTVEFAVEGLANQEKAYRGCFSGDTLIAGTQKEVTTTENTALVGECSFSETTSGSSDITYRVYTDNNKGENTVAQSAKQHLDVIELKSTKPETWNIVKKGCSVEFDVMGLYSNPPLRSVCGFYQEGKWVDETLVDSTDEETVWTPVALSEDGPDKDFAAWKLDKKSLEVKATDPKKEDVSAGCKFYVDGQEYVEFELTQMIAFTTNEKSCEANPLKEFEASYEGDNEIAVTSFGEGENCWTGETYSTSQITCDNSKAFTVFCDGGEYKYTDGSVEKPAKYDSNTTALAFADETCGTAAILPVSLLVGALALLASRA